MVETYLVRQSLQYVCVSDAPWHLITRSADNSDRQQEHVLTPLLEISSSGRVSLCRRAMTSDNKGR